MVEFGAFREKKYLAKKTVSLNRCFTVSQSKKETKVKNFSKCSTFFGDDKADFADVWKKGFRSDRKIEPSPSKAKAKFDVFEGIGLSSVAVKSSESNLNSLECWDYSVELECLQGPNGKINLQF